MQAKTNQSGFIYCVKFAKKANSPQELDRFSAQVATVVSNGWSPEARAIAVDLSTAEGMASRMCGMLATLSVNARTAGVRFFVILPANHDLRKILTLTRVEQMLDIRPTLDECEKALQKGKPSASMNRVTVLFSPGGVIPKQASPDFMEKSAG